MKKIFLILLIFGFVFSFAIIFAQNIKVESEPKLRNIEILTNRPNIKQKDVELKIKRLEEVIKKLEEDLRSGNLVIKNELRKNVEKNIIRVKERLNKAKKAFREKKYGEAFGLTTNAESLINNVLRILEKGTGYKIMKQKEEMTSKILEKRNVKELNVDKPKTEKVKNNIKIEKEISKRTYSIQEVSRNNSKESCWSVIRGKVYNLTNWINQHPGGPDKILNICGRDGSSIFEKVHGGQTNPERLLKNFEIGILKNN